MAANAFGMTPFVEFVWALTSCLDLKRDQAASSARCARSRKRIVLERSEQVKEAQPRLERVSI